jgi:TonB family protein
MSFSNIAIAQREKEIKALKSFLVFSTISSLVLHIAVLASGLGNLLARVPELEEEPIELTLVEPEVKETPLTEEKPKEEKLALGNNAGEVLTSSGGNAGGGSIGREVPQTKVIQAPPQAPIRISPVEKSVEKPIVTPVQKFVNNFKPQPVKEDPIVSKEPQPKVESQKPTNTQRKENTPIQDTQPPSLVTKNTTQIQPSTTTQASSENLRNLLGQIRDNRTTEPVTESIGSGASESNKPGGGSNSPVAFGNGNGLGTGTGNSTGNGRGTFGNGDGNALGTGTGNGRGTSERRKREIATAPIQPKLPTEVEKPESSGNPNGSLDGRAACRDCKVKYSESARRRRSEGRVEVAVDTDKDGNVTKVRVVNSSGDRDLDAEHVRQAEGWKLKPSEVGREGVKIATEYSIEGSRRNRQVRERQQQRQEQERQRVATSSSDNNSSEATPRRQRRLEASTNNTDVTTTSRRKRNLEASQETASSNSQESRGSRLNRRLGRQNQENTVTSENTTPRRVRRSQENSFSDRLRRRNTENNSGEEAPRRRREVTADVRTSGTQATPTRRRKRNINQSNQSPDNGSRLRNALRRSREVAPPIVPSSEGKNSE